jgi:hypothetical protein
MEPCTSCPIVFDHSAFSFVLNAGFIDSASAQKRSGRSLFSLILVPEGVDCC